MTDTEREIDLHNLEKRAEAARKAGHKDAVRKLEKEIKRLQGN